MGVTLDACSSSSPSSAAVPDAQTSGDPCALSGGFHVTFAPTADSPAACSCGGQCSYDVAPSHITDSISLASSNVHYFLQPLLTPDAGLPAEYGCNSTETSACTFHGECLGTFTFTVSNGAASGTQIFGFNTPDGGIDLCTYQVTASPCAPVGSAVCRF